MAGHRRPPCERTIVRACWRTESGRSTQGKDDRQTASEVNKVKVYLLCLLRRRAESRRRGRTSAPSPSLWTRMNIIEEATNGRRIYLLRPVRLQQDRIGGHQQIKQLRSNQSFISSVSDICMYVCIYM